MNHPEKYSKNRLKAEGKGKNLDVFLKVSKKSSARSRKL